MKALNGVIGVINELKTTDIPYFPFEGYDGFNFVALHWESRPGFVLAAQIEEMVGYSWEEIQWGLPTHYGVALWYNPESETLTPFHFSGEALSVEAAKGAETEEEAERHLTVFFSDVTTGQYPKTIDEILCSPEWGANSIAKTLYEVIAYHDIPNKESLLEELEKFVLKVRVTLETTEVDTVSGDKKPAFKVTISASDKVFGPHGSFDIWKGVSHECSTIWCERAKVDGWIATVIHALDVQLWLDRASEVEVEFGDGYEGPRRDLWPSQGVTYFWIFNDQRMSPR